MAVVSASDTIPEDPDRPRRLLHERAVLTRAWVHELVRAKGSITSERVSAARGLLYRWIIEHHEVATTTNGCDTGLAQMPMPAGHEAVMAELQTGEEIWKAVNMAFTADRQSELDDDLAHLRKLLDAYPY